MSRFIDMLRGVIQVDKRLAGEDFIIHRRDALFAYNLAIVVDDHFQGVNEIVRGTDLNEIVRGTDLIDHPTVRQISLYQHFGWPLPQYIHLPLALTPQGKKLSK